MPVNSHEDKLTPGAELWLNNYSLLSLQGVEAFRVCPPAATSYLYFSAGGDQSITSTSSAVSST